MWPFGEIVPVTVVVKVFLKNMLLFSVQLIVGPHRVGGNVCDPELTVDFGFCSAVATA